MNLEKQVFTGLTLSIHKRYVGGIEYTGANLEGIYHAEGRLTPNGATFRYEYTLKDHLGNSRVSFAANGTAIQVLQENHYYPFGMEMRGSWIAQSGTENAYQYTGKELNEDFSLNWSDYGARWYDASVGRWNGVDLLADVAHDWTPYRYGFNNPLIYNDLFGLFENKKEARRYRREHNIDGEIVKTTEDGTTRYEIHDKNAGSAYYQGEDGEIVQIALITGESPKGYQAPFDAEKASLASQGTLGPVNPSNSRQIMNFMGGVKDAGIAGGLIYDTADPLWVFLQNMNPLDTDIRHMNGDGILGSEKGEDVAGVAALIIPQLKALSAKSAMYKAAKFFNKMNMGSFNKAMKGSFIARMSPKSKGKLVRNLNKVLDTANEQMPNSTIFHLPKVGKAIVGGPEEKDNKN